MSIKTSKILIPIDFSNQSMYALNQACSLAQTKNSKVYILSVIEEQNKISSLFLDDQTDILQNKVKSKLNQICEEIQSKYKIDIEVMVSKGKVYNQIIDVSKMISTDLIVMGTTGSPKEGFKRFIGSNAERVVRLAQCPVITIKGQNLRNGCQNIILPLDLEKENIYITTNSELTLNAVIDVIRQKAIKRKLSLKIFDFGLIENISGNKVKQTISLKKGLNQEIAKKISKKIREEIKKINVSINGEALRVASKSKNDLQLAIKLLDELEESHNIPLQAINFR